MLNFLSSINSENRCTKETIESGRAENGTIYFKSDKRMGNVEESATRKTSQDIMDIISFV